MILLNTFPTQVHILIAAIIQFSKPPKRTTKFGVPTKPFSIPIKPRTFSTSSIFLDITKQSRPREIIIVNAAIQLLLDESYMKSSEGRILQQKYRHTY